MPRAGGSRRDTRGRRRSPATRKLWRSNPPTGRRASFFFSSFFVVGWRLRPGIRAWSPPGEGQGVRGGTPLHPLRPPYSPCPCGGGRLCRMSCTLSAARRRGQSARIFPLRGRYARLLRRSRVAGIASAPRLAGLLRIFPACALSGREEAGEKLRSPAIRQGWLPRRGVRGRPRPDAGQAPPDRRDKNALFPRCVSAPCGPMRRRRCVCLHFPAGYGKRTGNHKDDRCHWRRGRRDKHLPGCLGPSAYRAGDQDTRR